MWNRSPKHTALKMLLLCGLSISATHADIKLTIASSVDSTPKTVIAYGASGETQQIIAVRFDAKGAKITQRLPIKIGGGTTIYTPERRLLYVATPRSPQDNGNRLIVVAVDAKGVLTLLATVNMTHGTSYMSLDQTGQYLLTASYSEGTIDVYKLDDKGIPRGPVCTRNEGRKNAHSILQAPHHNLVCVPYVKEFNALYQYSLDARTGQLVPLKPAQADVPDDIGPRHLAYHPTKPFVYFSNEQQVGASVYRIGQAGTLTHLQVCAPGDLPPATGLSASDCRITPDGRLLFTGQRSKSNSELNGVNRYGINDDGTLTWLGITPADLIPWGLMVTPDGKHLLVTASSGGTLTRYAIEKEGGLTKCDTIPWGKSIRSIGVVELE